MVTENMYIARVFRKRHIDMKVELDSKVIRADLENKNISYRELHRMRVSRKICDEISKSNDEPVEVPIPALITLAEIVKRPHSSILTKDSLDDLRGAYPEVYESSGDDIFSSEGEFDYWIATPARNKSISTKLPWSPSRSLSAKPSERQKRELPVLADRYKKYAACEIEWLANVKPSIVMDYEREFQNIESGLKTIIENKSSLDQGASSNIATLARKAKELISAKEMVGELESDSYQIFHLAVTRASIFTQEYWEENEESHYIDSKYRFEEKPLATGHFLIIGKPKDKYIILRALKKKVITMRLNRESFSHEFVPNDLDKDFGEKESMS